MGAEKLIVLPAASEFTAQYTALTLHQLRFCSLFTLESVVMGEMQQVSLSDQVVIILFLVWNQAL